MRHVLLFFVGCFVDMAQIKLNAVLNMSILIDYKITNCILGTFLERSSVA